MNLCQSSTAVSLATVLVVAQASAGTIRVPEDQISIQAAVLAAASGDTVSVSPGTYSELIRMRDGVVLKSAVGPDSTILVSPGLGENALEERLLECPEGVGPSTVIEGFTMRISTHAGTAIHVENASPTIRGNVIEGFGFGINLRFSKSLIEENEFRECRQFALLCFASSPRIRRNSFHDNKPQAINISGKESRPIIGGSSEDTNKLFANTISVFNGSRNDIDATWNDWGWETTVEMDAKGFPADIATIVDGNDADRTHRGKGKVDYRHWIRPQEAGAPASAGSTPRVLVPILVAAVLIAAFVALSRRRKASGAG